MFYDMINESADYIKARLTKLPSVGIVLGSGLGKLVDAMENKTVIPYGDIPHFPVSSVAGHEGNLVVGDIAGITVAVRVKV